MIQIVDKIELMILTGYTDAQASKLIRKAKQKLLQDGFEWHGNKKVGRVPLKTIEDILGVELSAKHGIINPVLEDTVNE